MRTSSRSWWIIALFAGVVVMSAPAADTPSDLAAIAGWKGAAPKSPDAFSFVVLSDRTGGHEPGLYERAIEQVNLLQPDFVICVGDLIEGYQEDPAILDEMWQEFEGIVAKLEAPFFYCPGNHDASNPVMRKLYAARHGKNGKPYYSFGYRGCHFVVLDMTWALSDASFGEEQLGWLAEDLAAAKDADHVYLFWHQPLWEDPAYWPRMRKLLPAGKTTIFNGHWHELRYQLADGIPTYVLASTGAKIRTDRWQGDFPMFARVAVDGGKETISLLPVDEVLPGEFAMVATWTAGLTTPGKGGVVLLQGGDYLYERTNPFDKPLDVELSWDAADWVIEPATAKLSIAPGETAQVKFHLKPRAAEAARPVLCGQYRYFAPGKETPTSMRGRRALGVIPALEVVPATGVKVDGDLADWPAGKGFTVAQAQRICSGNPKYWEGPADCAYTLRAAHDGERLLVAIDVSDSAIDNHGDNPWVNDAIEFYWDIRPAAQRDGARGPGTGQVITVVPDEGKAAEPNWYIGDQAKPEHWECAFRRREGGYIGEIAVPLSELGFQGKPKPGTVIHLDVMIDDRDPVGPGRTSQTYMNLSGVGEGYKQSWAWAPATFR